MINESLNVGKHFISDSSVFIRQGQPLAGRERAVTFITTTRDGGRERERERERDLPSLSWRKNKIK